MRIETVRIRFAVSTLKHLSFGWKQEMRFRRREMVFDKGEIRKKNVAKTVNVAEINEKRRPCTGASLTPGHGSTIPIIGGHQLPSDDMVRGG